MTGELIKEVKHIQQCLVNKDMEGEEWEEKMEMVHNWKMWLHISRTRWGAELSFSTSERASVLSALYPAEFRKI